MKHISSLLRIVLHTIMMFLGALISLKQTKVPETLKLINRIATIIYVAWLISKSL